MRRRACSRSCRWQRSQRRMLTRRRRRRRRALYGFQWQQIINIANVCV